MFSKVETLFWAFMRGFCGGVNKVSPSLILTEKGFLGGFVPLITFFSHQQKYTGGQKHIQRYTGCAQTKDIVHKQTTSWVLCHKNVYAQLISGCNFIFLLFLYLAQQLITFQKRKLKFGQIHFAIKQIYFANLTKTFCNLDKYIFQFEQIHFAIWTNIFYGFISGLAANNFPLPTKEIYVSDHSEEKWYYPQNGKRKLHKIAFFFLHIFLFWEGDSLTQNTDLIFL